jgi:hypothetical protein
LKKGSTVFIYITLSIAAAFLLLILAFSSNSNIKTIGIYDRYFVSIFFIISCLIGVSLTIHPGWIRKSLKGIIKNSTTENIKKTDIKREGHHPNCDKFKNHIFRFKSRVYCTGCLGLAIGCVISIILIIFYNSIYVKISPEIYFYLIIVGMIIVGFVFIEIISNKRNLYIHIISNSFLIIGFLIIIIGITEITGDKIYGIISIIFSFLWLDTRIQLSNWHHGKICSKCCKSCKMY